MSLDLEKMDPQFRENIVDISIHCLIAAALALLIYLKSADMGYVLIFLLGSVFIDLDHLVDYFICFKNGFSIRSFLCNEHVKSGRIYIIFHSWELIFVIFILGLIFKSAGSILLSVAMAVHIISDSVMHRRIAAYFLAFRMAKRFDAKIFS